MQYEKLTEIYKFNQDEHIKMEKFVLRSKKKTISYLNQQSKKNRKKYCPEFEDFQQELREKELKTKKAREVLPTFDAIYSRKLEAEARAKEES